jgi:hypothetical protein
MPVLGWRKAMVPRLRDWRRALACDLDVSFDDWSKLQKTG